MGLHIKNPGLFRDRPQEPNRHEGFDEVLALVSGSDAVVLQEGHHGAHVAGPQVDGHRHRVARCRGASWAASSAVISPDATLEIRSSRTDPALGYVKGVFSGIE